MIVCVDSSNCLEFRSTKLTPPLWTTDTFLVFRFVVAGGDGEFVILERAEQLQDVVLGVDTEFRHYKHGLNRMVSSSFSNNWSPFSSRTSIIMRFLEL